jgi:Ni/Fe-hydrogenase subunit HybB-like protein
MRGREVSAFLLRELRPKGPLLTPFNVISIPVIIAGLVILVFRFIYGLGAVTNLSQEFPWGFWIGFDVVTGVALAGGAYVITLVVYVLKVEKYRPIVRATVLNGLLAYIFYAGALVLDLGRPWHIVNPIIGNSFGYNSVLFLVSWHFLLYMVAEFVEFSPVVAEWLHWKRARKVLHGLTLGAVIFGVTLSTLHQSGLGALFLLAKSKIHPLWYTEFIPILFFVSSIFAGLSMIIVEGSITHRVFRHQIDGELHTSFDEIIIGLGKGASLTMFVYYFFKALIFVHERQWDLMRTGWGVLYVIEVVGLVLIPCFMFAYGVRNRRLEVIRIAAVLTLMGVILNRLNISVIAFNWTAPVRYYPSWEIWVFRWIVLRMPVLRSNSTRPSTPQNVRLSVANP